MLSAEHPLGKRIFRQSTMAKDILVWHLNTVGPLCSDFLDGSSYVHGSGVLQPRYANIQRAKCTWKRVSSTYIRASKFLRFANMPPSHSRSCSRLQSQLHKVCTYLPVLPMPALQCTTIGGPRGCPAHVSPLLVSNLLCCCLTKDKNCNKALAD